MIEIYAENAKAANWIETFLPDTPCRHAASAFYCGEIAEEQTYRDPEDNRILVTIRAADEAKGNAYGQPCEANMEDLQHSAQVLAATLLLATHWPDADTKRDAASRALIGTLLAVNTAADDIASVLNAIASIGGDTMNREYMVKQSIKRKEAGKQLAGKSSMVNVFGRKVVNRWLLWMEIERVSEEEQPAADALDLRLAEIACTDLGNAERLVQRHGQDLRYCVAHRAWYVWAGERWQRDDTQEIVRRAKSTVQAIKQEGNALPKRLNINGEDKNEQKRNQILAWAEQSQSRARITAAIELAQSDANIAVTTEAFDPNPWLFNVLNGTLDLRTGLMTEHRRDDLLTKIAPVAFDPQATCPTFEAFLARVQPDSSVRRYLQEVAGYTLTGETGEQCLFFFYGGGRNGKSTYTELFSRLMGDYWVKTRAQTFMVQHGSGGIPNDVASLMGRRMVTCAEIGEGDRLSEALIKDITGGDTMSARFLHAEFFTFQPVCKLWLYGNHKPAIRGGDKGIWRRIKLIPWLITISDEEVDANLPHKLHSEMSGVLNWALAGLRLWRERGLTEPEIVQEATREYRGEMDIISQWVEENCVRLPGGRSRSGDLYADYRAWCEQAGEYMLTQTKFSQRLIDLNYRKVKSNGVIFWNDISLRHEPFTARYPSTQEATTPDPPFLPRGEPLDKNLSENDQELVIPDLNSPWDFAGTELGRV